jgi:hypothetical protein
MQAFVEGPVQISTKINNYNKIVQPNLFTSGASFVTEDIRQLWGNLWSSHPMPNTSSMDDITYNQSLDQYTKYANRSLPLHSNFMTAAARNSHNDFIVTYATPLFQTNEQNFHIRNTEWNQIEFDDLPEGGIPNETTHTTWGWTDTTNKKVQGLHFSVDLAHDPIYGMNTFIDHFAQLASCCMLSIYKTAYYSIVHTAYQNKVFDWTSKTPFDVSQLFLAEQEAFFAFAKDPSIGFNLIREEVRQRSGLDLVLLPEGGGRWVKEPNGAPRQLRSRQLTYNQVLQQFEHTVDEPGPNSYMSYQIGDDFLDFMETRSFQVNSLDKRLENPLCTKVTLCQFYPPNPDRKVTDKPRSTDPELLDITIFYQTKEEGEDRRIAFKDSLSFCGYWDPVSGEIHDDVLSYIDELNRKSTHHNAPWQWRASQTQDVNRDIGDYETPTPEALNAIGHVTDLRRMTSVRDKFVGVLYDTVDQQYKKVDLVGSNHLDTLSNAWLMQVVETLTLKYCEKTGQHIVTGLQQLYGLLEDLKNGQIDQAYIEGVIDANMPASMTNGMSNLNPYTKNGLPEMRANHHGALRLPSNEVATLSGIVYPNGWHHGPGLLTLKDEVLKVESPYRFAARRASDSIDFVRTLITFLRTFIGNTEIIDHKLAAKWYQFEGRFKSKDAVSDAEVATFIDAIWEPSVPTFLGVPAASERGVGSGPSGPEDANRARTLNPGINSFVSILRTNTDPAWKFTTAATTTRVVTESVRAYAALSIDVAIAHKEGIFSQPATDAANEALQAYFRCVITQTKPTEPANDDQDKLNRQLANAITQRFFEYYSLGTDTKQVEAAAKFIKAVTSPRTAGQQAKELQTLVSFTSTGFSLASNLLEWERGQAGRKDYVNDIVGSASQTKADRGNLRTGTGNVTYFDGNYRTADGNGLLTPDQYLRSPFASSPKLRDFIRVTGSRWAIPADRNTMYTTPDQGAIRGARDDDDYGRDDNEEEMLEEHPAEVHVYSRFSGAFNELYEHYLESGGAVGGADNLDMEEEQPQGLASGQLFSFGAPGQQLRPRLRDGQVADYVPYLKKNRPDPNAAHTADLRLRLKYPGPFVSRLNYLDHNIDDPIHKVFFLALILAENKLPTHHKLANCNAKLINVLLFRPFIELFACSIIVMKAGPESGAVPVSRFDTFISKEDRGYFHIGCSYYSGFIRLQPQNFRMIPYCLPDRFVGGKKTDFMTKADEWIPNNPNKPSIIALPTPVSEVTYGSPVPMSGGETVKRPDVDFPTWTTKYSAYGFYEHRFTTEKIQEVDASHLERYMYKKVTHASHVAHRGWRAFKDATTGQLKEYDGSGPACTRAENMPGCQWVYNGRQNTFTPDHQTMYTKARAQ